MARENRTASNGAHPAEEEIGGHWQLLVFEGVFLMIFGLAAIVLPSIAIVGVAILLGWLFLAAGIIGLATTLMARKAPGFWWAIASAATSMVAGAVLTIWPMNGLLPLAFVLAGFLFADGLLIILFGIDHRRQLSRQWGWLVTNGVIDLLLAPAILVATFFGPAVWLLSLVIGIDMLFGGSSLVGLAIASRPK